MAELQIDTSQTIRWNRIARKIGVPIGGLAFLFDAVAFARKCIADELSEVEIEPRHITAAQLCNSFVRLAQETFGEEYIAALSSWGLETSEKLGRVVYALVRRDLLVARYPDQQSDFDGKFDFSNICAEPIVTRVFSYPTDHLPPISDPYRFSVGKLLVVTAIVALWLASIMSTIRKSTELSPTVISPMPKSNGR